MKYQEFIFEKYELDKLKNEIRFYYNFDQKINFIEKLRLDFKGVAWSRINPELLNKVLFNLHLIIGVSYWKAYCQKKIKINSGALNKRQAAFWNKLYNHGLGEFFYKNKIDWRGLIDFPAGAKAEIRPIKYQAGDKILAALGGGKDSIVTAELLKRGKLDFALFSLGDSLIQAQTAELIGKKRVIIKRIIDRKLFALNAAGAYNGHIPISAIYSFASLLAAVLYNYKYLVFSNERSANYGNTEYLERKINHQYSKSAEFEKDFAGYIKRYITPDLIYFSLLRQWSELKIVKYFSREKKYFKVFSSCNKNFAINKRASRRWCGVCAKCAYVFCQLAAFLPKKELLKIFGRNLYADKPLLNLYSELLGEKNLKPFDCVGTPAEARAAMFLCRRGGEFNDDYILKHFTAKILPKIKNIDKLHKITMSNRGWHNLPPQFRALVK